MRSSAPGRAEAPRSVVAGRIDLLAAQAPLALKSLGTTVWADPSFHVWMMARGRRVPGRDVEVVRLRRPPCDAAVPCFRFSGFLAFPAVGLLPGQVGFVTVAVVVVLAAVWLWVRKVRAEVRAAEGRPFLVSWRRSPGIVGAESEPPPGEGWTVRPDAAHDRWPWRTPPAQARGPGRPERRPIPTPEEPVVPMSGGVHAILVAEVASRAATRPTPAAEPSPAPPRQLAVAPSSEPVQPMDATLQFLPGRLVTVGATRRPDIRFVRRLGGPTEVTLGRHAGPPDRHVWLDAATVSRLHARMRFQSDRWTITNLSRTNPVRLNGGILLESAGPQPLEDGDRVELGEYVFVFRER